MVISSDHRHLCEAHRLPERGVTATVAVGTGCTVLTPLAPLPGVAVGTGAHVVPHALASVVTGGAAHGWNTSRTHAKNTSGTLRRLVNNTLTTRQ